MWLVGSEVECKVFVMIFVCWFGMVDDVVVVIVFFLFDEVGFVIG